MIRYSDKTGHFYLWLPFFKNLDLMTCDERKMWWPLMERKGSLVHRLALRLNLLWRIWTKDVRDPRSSKRSLEGS